MDNYDIAIIGAGVSGAFASYILAGKKNLKTCLLEFGRPPNKRRKQLEGWLGCLPNSNARWYLQNDYNKIENISFARETSNAEKFVMNLIKDCGPVKELKNREPSDVLKNRFKKFGYLLTMYNFIQWVPENIHKLSRKIGDYIYDRDNFCPSFDNEVRNIEKINDLFILETESGEISAKKILLCSGRSGWRFANKLYKKFNILLNDDYAYFGFRAEISTSCMKEWNHCSCSIYRDNLFVGPVSWNGTVIQEDHDDLVISSWRSNEERWNSDKAAFSVIGRSKFDDNGLYQTERLSKLAYILCDNRVGKIKIRDFIGSKHDILNIPEYKPVVARIKEIEKIIPSFVEKGYIYLPDILTYMHDIKVNNDFSTNFENLYVAGESAGISGIYAAALSGTIAANNMVGE